MQGGYTIRRATTDDVEQLIAVLKASALPSEDLEKRFTEFQVAQSADGTLVAAIALQIAGTDGQIHSEAFVDFSLTDAVRPLLWQRVAGVARNHGLFRLWTLETAPFWKKDAGFAPASGPAPEAFGPAGGAWLALRLKEESADPELLEKQFQLFREVEQAKREKILRRAAALKTVGTGISVVFFISSMALLLWYFLHRK